MSKFKWDRSTISPNEINEQLFIQYGSKNFTSVNVDDMDRQLPYESSLVPVKCNRCGHSFKSTPKMILESIDDKGAVCTRCNNLTIDEIRAMRQTGMREKAAEDASDYGIDLNELEKEKEEEEKDEKSSMLDDYDINTMNDEISEEDIRAEESAEGITPDVEIDEDNEVDNSANKYMYDESDEKSPLEEAIDDFNEDDAYDPDAEETEDVENSESVEEEEIVVEEISEESVTPDVEDDVETIVSEETPEESEEPEESFIINNKRMTVDEIENALYEAKMAVVNKLKFDPYVNKSEIVSDDNKLVIGCAICGKEFKIDSPEELHDGIITLTKEYCVSRGIPFKAPFGKIAKLHYCPHCINSTKLNGYNEYMRKLVENTCTNSNLKLVKPDNYWYASPKEDIIVEANGITKQISIETLFSKYINVDATKLKEFTPKGDGTKSATDSKENGVRNSTEFKEFDKRTKSSSMLGRPVNGTAVDSNSILNKEFEEQNASVKENSVFPENFNIEDKYSKVAKLANTLNPFIRSKTLIDEYESSVFAPFIKDLSKETKIDYNVRINSKTYELPIVDFENGFRIICINIDDNFTSKVPYDLILRNVKFSYDEFKEYYTLYLYSDSIVYRREATMNSLVKTINPSVLPYKGACVKLSDSDVIMNLQYTDYLPWLKEFDSQCSSFPSGKPKNGQLGLIATWRDVAYDSKGNILTSKKGSQFGRTEYSDILALDMSINSGGNKSSLSQLNDEYSQYMVASIKYIERYNKDTDRVVYTITDYIEIGSTILYDGFSQCLKALMKEYSTKYPGLTTVPHVIVEIDSNEIPSPSLHRYVEENYLIPMDDMYRSIVDGKSFVKRGKEAHLKYSYVRRLEYRSKNKDSDWFRQDMRMFGAGTIIKTMADELKAAGIASGIRDEGTRLAFISNMGFMKANQCEVKEYFVSQDIIQNILIDPETTLLQKTIPDNLFSKSKMVDNSNMGYAMNNILTNPVLFNKYYNIMHGSQEARDYFIQNVLYRDQQDSMLNGVNMNNPMMMNGMGMYNNMDINPMMGMGMPGMNPMMGGMMGGMNPYGF